MESPLAESPRAARSWAAALCIAASLSLLSACQPDFHAGYAEIVAEEDARGAEGMQQIRRHLEGRSAELRAMAVRALGRMEDPGLVDEIAPLLDDPDPAVQAAARHAMAQAVFREEPGAVEALRAERGGTGVRAEDAEALMADADWAERRRAVLAVATGGADEAMEAAEAVIAFGLADPDPRVRVDALAAYDSRLREAQGCGPIVAALADPDPRVSVTAVRLAARPCPEVAAQADALLALVTGTGGAAAEAGSGEAGSGASGCDGPDAASGPCIRAARALHSLARIAPDRARAAIPRFADHPSGFVRAWAARAAGAASEREILVRLARDEVANVREAALGALDALDQGEGRAGRVADSVVLHLAVEALAASDPQLVMTAARIVADRSPDGAAAQSPALLASLARFTAAGRETDRDVRVALLNAVGAAGAFAADELEPYLADHDPVVAGRAAELLNEGVEPGGDLVVANPTPLPRAPTPDAERLRALERSLVVLEMAHGDIVIALRPDLAATNADRFARLAADGVLDGLTFHRVEPNFVIQGASPNANEYAGHGPYTRDEISARSHLRGTVGLSTRGRDTGDGQIFVNLVDNIRLDFNYTILGEVVEGMEVVDRVEEGAVIERATWVPDPDPARPGARGEAWDPAGAVRAWRAEALAARVEIRRTEYGVPHILAEDLEAMGFALGYAQSEDYGASIATAMVGSRGRLALHLGAEELDSDFVARETHARAAETFERLDPRARDVYAGFAMGVNHYIRLHPDEFPLWIDADFTGIDALARDVQTWSRGDAARLVRGLTDAAATARQATDDRTPTLASAPAPANESAPADAPAAGPLASDDRDRLLDGSNAWAFHGSRTASGGTMLLRNPHLRWDGNHPLLERPSGFTYYEAHVRVPGVIDFYGDFRIGTAFGIIGGFNPHLGWATTNNYPTLSQAYRLEAHPTLPDHVVLDGEPMALERREASVEYLTPDGQVAVESRTTWHTPHGPVVHRTAEHAWVLKDPRDGEFRRGEQFLRMMTASDLDEWLEVMKMRAHPTSNFTYADAEGNIAHYYNARLPLLPHPVTGDTAAHATTRADIWSELVPWDDLPLYLNPPGGYVQQANDPPDFTNLNVPMDRDTMPPNLPEPRLRLRSQLSLELAAGSGDGLTLEQVMRLKHSPRMLLAERTVDDLLDAIDGWEGGIEQAPPNGARSSDSEGGGSGAIREAAAVLASWDRTAAAESRGGVLFERWAGEYFGGAPDSLRWREPWDPERPAETPFGLRDPEGARSALDAAIASLARDGIALDARWGDVHRVVRGDVDAPVSGCPPTLGCFRTLSFEELDDGRRAANRGDAWVLLVEFGGASGSPQTPRAYTVLAYGQTARTGSPHFADQAGLFARGEMKAVAWTEEEIGRAAVRSYRP